MQAKRLADAEFAETTALKIGLPWVNGRIRRNHGSSWATTSGPTGSRANRKTLATMARYSYEQGLAVRLLTVEEMFARRHTERRDASLGRAIMPVQLICCSHSPLMTTDVEETEQDMQAQFFREMDSCAAALHKFDPDLVVVFGPDHFNGFFYELMPAFCIGTAAEGTKDWHLESGPLRVPRELALACVRLPAIARLRRRASRTQMKVDHGITIPLFKLTGALARYSVLPVFINCAADPRPSFRRVRAFGEAIGEFLAEQGHEDHAGRLGRPVARSADAADRPEPAGRRAPADRPGDALAGRARRARKPRHQGGEGSRRRQGPLPAAERAMGPRFPDTFLGSRLDDFDAMTDAEIDRIAGFGAHEVRTWVAAAAAAQRWEIRARSFATTIWCRNGSPAWASWSVRPRAHPGYRDAL